MAVLIITIRKYYLQYIVRVVYILILSHSKANNYCPTYWCLCENGLCTSCIKRRKNSKWEPIKEDTCKSTESLDYVQENTETLIRDKTKDVHVMNNDDLFMSTATFTQSAKYSKLDKKKCE